ncbi:hypothetical protein GGX14DRAFT_623058 [Mycena pura]|uniref:F-box domain-containing protein n=1 Tax=Mycena pura TaxID=153505 RepID=A0AAD6VFK5_9AGAR|nr:hypothetical protein GGX14DRAFT_623058 [Mycena pura]
MDIALAMDDARAPTGFVLPFLEDDPCGEFGEQQARIRDRLATNHVAVECWKTLRIPQTQTLRKRANDLSLFPQMHIDILFEVLGHLHPIDLMHVARANQTFRALLHAPAAAGIWRQAFLGRAPLPPCPSQISGRRWATLLFGPQQCDECGKSDTFPDYTIWRRLCTHCMGDKLSNGVPGYGCSQPVNDLLAKTYRFDGSLSDYTDSIVGRLWPADGLAVAGQYERLKAADAASALDVFVEHRKQIVQETEKLAEEAKYWADAILEEAQTVVDTRLRRLVRSVRKRLVQEGHDPRDVDSAHELGESAALEHVPRLTSKHWHKARPYLLPFVDAARRERLKRERAQLMGRRSAVVITAAAHVLRTAPRETWAYNPPNYAIETFPPLQELIQDPSDARLAEDDARLADALLGLPAFVEAWREEKRALLASLLPLPAACSPDAAAALALQRLPLATSVFTCLGSWVSGTTVTAGRSLIGWEGAGAHLRCRSLHRFWNHRPHYAADGAAAARALVRLVGLDPETTTAAQMDRLCGDGRAGDTEKRFLCALCPAQRHKRVRGRHAMRWRECVLHTIERTRLEEDVAHQAPVWVLLTDAGAEDVRRREPPDPVANDNAWVCTVCTDHYEGRVTRWMVMDHLCDKHAIRNPIEGQHFIHFAGAERTPRVLALLSQEEHVADLRCNRCPKGKLRSLRAIPRHVSDKHEIATPSEADWTRVERILRATPTPADGSD